MAVRSIIGYECVHVIGRAVACKTGAVIAAVCVVTLSVFATDSTQLTLIFICKTGAIQLSCDEQICIVTEAP